MAKIPSDLLEVMILALIDRLGPAYGWKIKTRIKNHFEIEVDSTPFYRAIQSLKANGHLIARDKHVKKEDVVVLRRTYYITVKGDKRLESRLELFATIIDFVKSHPDGGE